MKSSEYLAFCQNELRRSKKWRSDTENDYEGAWRRYIDLYQGKQYSRPSGDDQLIVNMVFATKNVMAPAVAINNPKFVVNAQNPESLPQSMLTEEILNYLWRTNDYQQEFRLAVDDWLIIGHGWVKCGYKFVKKPEEKKTETEWEQVGVSEGSDEGVDDREDTDGNVESEMVQTDDRPFIERISPFDMYVDPDARHPKEWRWVAQRTWRALPDVQVDSRYSATARKRVTGTSWSRWDTQNGDGRNNSDKPQRGAITYAEIIEFYDIRRNKVCTFAISNNDSDNTETAEAGYLIKPKAIPYASGQPFLMMRNYEIPDHFYPMGDIAQIESLQLELNETRTQMLNHRKKFRRAWIYQKDDFDKDGIKALESGEDNVLIPVQSDGDPSNSIAPLPAAITPPEFYDQSAMISTDLDRISGVSDYQRGAQTAIKRTATEAAMIQDAANARAQDRLAKVESVLSQLGERIVQLMQQYLTGEHVARIVTMPTKAWLHYDNDRIQGKFDFSVQGGSTEPQNETFRRQSAMQIVDASIPFMEAGVVNMPALYQELLSKGFGLKDAQRFIQQPEPEPPPGGPEGSAPPGGAPPDMQQAMPPGPPAPGPQQLTPEMFAQMVSGQGAPPPPPPEMNGMPPEMAMPPV